MNAISRKVAPYTALAPGRTALRMRSSIGSMPRRSESSSRQLSTASAAIGAPGAR